MEGEIKNNAQDSQPLLEEHGDDEEGEDKTINTMKILSVISNRPGIVWCLLAGIGQASQMVLVGEVVRLVSPMAAIFVRSIFLFIFVVSVSWKLSEEYDWLDIIYNNAFGFFDVISLCCVAVAMLYTRTSDVSSILFNEPIPAAIMACIFLGESFDIMDGALAIINGIGLVLICRISMDNSEHPDESSLFGIILSFGSLLCGTVVAIIGRALAHRNKADPSLMLVMVAFNGIMWPSIYLSITSSFSLPATGHDLLVCLLLGLVTAFSAYAYTRLLKTESALLATVSLTLSIPLTFVYDVLFKGRIIFWQTVVGICLTIGSTICLYVKSYQFT